MGTVGCGMSETGVERMGRDGRRWQRPAVPEHNELSESIVIPDGNNGRSRPIAQALNAPGFRGAQEIPDVNLTTKRREQVASLVLSGMSDKQIADSLGISRTTVRSHRSAAHGARVKGCGRGFHAVTRAARNG